MVGNMKLPTLTSVSDYVPCRRYISKGYLIQLPPRLAILDQARVVDLEVLISNLTNGM
jgi:hypothetical protein